MTESDEEIYRRHFEMESEKIRVERIKAQAAIDAREANPTQREIEREEESKAREEQIRVAEEEELNKLHTWSRIYGVTLLLGLVFGGIYYFTPEEWVILGNILGGLILVSFGISIYFFLAASDLSEDRRIYKQDQERYEAMRKRHFRW